MTPDELKAQHARCVEWNDPDQWEALAFMYAAEGYYDNAAAYLRKAEELRQKELEVTSDPN